MNLKDLEWYFADHFDTVIFPVLAEHYLLKNDFIRAHKVCDIGLKHHPNSIEGLFIEAKTFIAEGELAKAEEILKKIIHLDPEHYNAHVILAEVQLGLNRADSTLKKIYQRILEMDSTNEKAAVWLSKQAKKKKAVAVKKEERPLKKAAAKKSSWKPLMKSEFVPISRKVDLKDELASLTISPKLATFTLVAILKDQKLYNQALSVLDIMSKKPGIDDERIEEERQTLMELMKEKE